LQGILIIGVVLLLSSLSSKVLYRYGIPTLIAFLALGIISGPEVLGLVHFDNLSFARQISDFALIFIMFSLSSIMISVCNPCNILIREISMNSCFHKP